MYLLYVDESENSDAKDSTPLSVFGLAGLVVTARYVPRLVEEISDLKASYGLPDDQEIRGYDIFQGKRRGWRGLGDEKRREFCRGLARIIAGKNALAKGFFVFKNSRLQRDDYLQCLDVLIDRSAGFVGSRPSNTGKQLLVIFDEKDEFEDSINRAILGQQGRVLRSPGSQRPRLCRIIDHGFPGKSKYSTMLQASDFVGYVLRLARTIQREPSLFATPKDPRFVDFVDELVDVLGKKVTSVSR